MDEKLWGQQTAEDAAPTPSREQNVHVQAIWASMEKERGKLSLEKNAPAGDSLIGRLVCAMFFWVFIGVLVFMMITSVILPAWETAAAAGGNAGLVLLYILLLGLLIVGTVWFTQGILTDGVDTRSNREKKALELEEKTVAFNRMVTAYNTIKSGKPVGEKQFFDLGFDVVVQGVARPDAEVSVIFLFDIRKVVVEFHES